jgi:hypothetical protein
VLNCFFLYFFFFFADILDLAGYCRQFADHSGRTQIALPDIFEAFGGSESSPKMATQLLIYLLSTESLPKIPTIIDSGSKDMFSIPKESDFVHSSDSDEGNDSENFGNLAHERKISRCSDVLEKSTNLTKYLTSCPSRPAYVPPGINGNSPCPIFPPAHMMSQTRAKRPHTTPEACKLALEYDGKILQSRMKILVNTNPELFTGDKKIVDHIKNSHKWWSVDKNLPNLKISNRP